MAELKSIRVTKVNQVTNRYCRFSFSQEHKFFIFPRYTYWCISCLLHGTRGIYHDDNFLDARSPGVLVAVNISNYKKRPVIWKVTEVHENEFGLDYWKGAYNSAWQPHFVKSKEGEVPWADALPKQSVIMCAFELDENNFLYENTRKFIKRWYREEARRQSAN
jgi:hypothetical protein